MGELGPDPSRFLESPPEIAAWTMLVSAPGAEGERYRTQHDGRVEIGGRSFTRMTAGTIESRLDDPQEDIVGVVRFDGDDLEIAELTFADLPGIGGLEVRGDPVRVRMNPPVGEAQSVAVDGWQVRVAGVPVAVSMTGSYTLMDAAASVETTRGTFSGCRHYRLQVSAGQVAGLPVALEAEAEIWAKTGIGVVAGWVESPLVDGGARRTLHLEDFQGGGDMGGGRSQIRADDVIDEERTSTRMSSYDLRGDFDADKNTHAKMLVELRWADPARARTDEQPPVDVEFTVPFGRIPHPGVFPLEASILNPHENGEGYRFWYAFADAAAKNMPTNGISYGAEVRWFGPEGTQPGKVLVSSVVNYRRYQP